MLRLFIILIDKLKGINNRQSLIAYYINNELQPKTSVHKTFINKMI